MSQLIEQMKSLRPLSALPQPSEPLLLASLLIPARHAAHSLEKTVTEARTALERYFGPTCQYEIILIPNPRPGDATDLTVQVAEQLAARYPGIVCSVPHSLPQGKGAALRTGFLASRGRWIFFTDADLPYDLEFLGRARQLLEDGSDLVTGNRRLASSQFDIPVGLLPIAYGRHRLGLGFNRVVRLLYPIIRTTDTQAGIKAMSRRLAENAFGRQSCPGFFFDIEIFLTALGHSYRIAEIPVTLFLNSEKSTVRLFREAILATFWLVRLAIRNLRGAYGR